MRELKKSEETPLTNGSMTPWLIAIAIFLVAVAVTTPMVIREKKKAEQTSAISSLRGIGLALFEFETEYGRFPDDSTAIAVASLRKSPAVTGGSANDCFLQLIRSGIVQSKTVFYAKTSFTRKPEDDIDTDTTVLDAGEVGFGLLMHSDGRGLVPEKQSFNCPVAVAPFTSEMDGSFDFGCYGGKAVVLKIDNSVASVNIDKSSGNVLIHGRGILQTGADTVWGVDTTPRYAFPIPK